MAEGGADEACISPEEQEVTSISPFEEQERQELNPKSEMSVVIMGKSGAGKSTLMKNMLKLNLKSELELSSGHITKENTTIKSKQYGVTFTATDTVGLMADIKKEGKKAYQQIRSSDLLIYCISVGMSSKFESEEIVIKNLDKNFGHDIWKKCIIAFTFSNQVIDRNKKKMGEDRAILSYKTYINEFTTKFEEKISKLKVRNISVKTVFDISPAAPQPADHTTIMAIPTGDEPEDQVLPGIECVSFKIVFPNMTEQIDANTWIDVLFIALLSKCNSDSKRINLIRRYFGYTGVQAGAIIGCIVGALGFIPGMAIGAAVGAGVGAIVDNIEKVKIEKK